MDVVPCNEAFCSWEKQDALTSPIPSHWPLDDVYDLIHVLSPLGKILYTNSKVKRVTGYALDEIEGQNFSEHLHPEDIHTFVSNFSNTMEGKGDMLVYLRLKTKTGDFTLLESKGRLDCSEQAHTGSNGSFKGLIVMSRSHPLDQRAVMDTFIDYKMQNELFQYTLDNLINGDECLDFLDSYVQNPSETLSGSVSSNVHSNSVPEIDTVEKVQSKPSPPVIAKSKRSSKKRRGNRKAHEYICSECATLDSPEWRRGPLGKKTLCNACGLRYSKQQKLVRST